MPGVTRRQSLALVVGLAVGRRLDAGAGEAGGPNAARLQLRIHRAASDGGQLVGSIELSDAVTAYLGSPAGGRAQLKWFDWTGREIGTMGLPSMIHEKVLAGLKSLPPED